MDVMQSTTLPAPRFTFHKARFTSHALVLLAYLLATVVFTWPLVTDLGGQVVHGFDSWQTAWSFWLFPHSLFDLHTWPWQTDLMYWPGGTSLYVHNYTLDSNLIVLPITLLFGPVVAYNVACLFVCVASGYAMYLLGRTLTGNGLAGFVAGFALTFNAWHIARLWGQLNLASYQWPLLYMFFLVRRDGRGWVNAAGAGLMLALTYLSGPYMVLYLGVFTALWALNRALERRVPIRQRLATLGRAVGAAALGGLLVAPLILGLLASTRSGEFLTPTFAETLTFSADPLGYLVPGEYSTVFGPAVRAFDTHLWGTVPIEKLIFPGWSVWILGIFGLLRAWPQTRLWLNLLLVSLVLSFGPVLHFNGAGLPVPLPYLGFYLLPGVEVSRTPVRFALLVQIALVVGLAYGVAALWQRVRGPARLELLPSASQIVDLRVPNLRPLLVLAALLAVITVEQIIAPLPIARLAIPLFYQQLAQEPGHFGILEAPLGDPPGPCQSDYLLYQITHQKPIIGGYISRLRFDPFIEGSPGVRDFRYIVGPPDILEQAAGGLPGVAPADGAARALLQGTDTRYIIVHKHLPCDVGGTGLENPATVARLMDRAAGISGAAPLYDDADLRVYPITGTPDPAQVVVQFGAGWQPARAEKGDPTVGRWADQGAEWLITTPDAQTVDLALTATAWGGSRAVQVLLNGVPRQDWNVGVTSARYETGAFLVPAGVSRLKLVSALPATPLLKSTPFDKFQAQAILRATAVTIRRMATRP